MIHLQAHVIINKSPQAVWQQAASAPDFPHPTYSPTPQNPYCLELPPPTDPDPNSPPMPDPITIGQEMWLTRLVEGSGVTILFKMTFTRWQLQPVGPMTFEADLLPVSGGQQTQLAVQVSIKTWLGVRWMYRRWFQQYLHGGLREYMASLKYAIEHDIPADAPPEAIPKEALDLAAVTITG